MTVAVGSPMPSCMVPTDASSQQSEGEEQMPLESIAVKEKNLATQLVHLASQYHASDYNRVKYGPKGSPTIYIPITFQSPVLVKEMQTRQILNAQEKAWWPCQRQDVYFEKHVVEMKSLEKSYSSSTEANESAHENETFINGTPLLMAPPLVDIQQEISAAMASPFPRLQAAFNGPMTHPTKTSDTHPINISMIIPLELLPTISSYVTPASRPSPVMFHVAHYYSLDRLTTPIAPPIAELHLHLQWQSQTNSFQLSSPPFVSHDSLKKSPSRTSTVSVHSQSLSGPLMAAPTLLTAPLVTSVSPSPRKVLRRIMTELPPVAADVSAAPSLQGSRSTDRLNRLIESHPGHERAFSAPPVSPTRKSLQISSSRRAAPSYRRSPEVASLTALKINSESVVHTSQPISKVKPMRPARPVSDLALSPISFLAQNHIINHQDWVGLSAFAGLSFVPPPVPPLPFQCEKPSLGNLFLSSCPGKKVRLTGPVKGRGSICRDLRQDLGRMKDLGVRCIICCLDDEELEFLGASWSEYSVLATEIGLDVLRLPTPEGLVPLAPVSLDLHLTRVINHYTLGGSPILVHCRGGVGRAGLVACCWLLKLGLCGWKNPALCHCQWRTDSSSEGVVCEATMQLVERVISVVRRRRSLKAIETYEQVKFLVEYVQYLETSSQLPLSDRRQI